MDLLMRRPNTTFKRSKLCKSFDTETGRIIKSVIYEALHLVILRGHCQLYVFKVILPNVAVNPVK